MGSLFHMHILATGQAASVPIFPSRRHRKCACLNPVAQIRQGSAAVA
jgi:hypothetical protein